MFNKKILSAISFCRKITRENGVLIVEHKLNNNCGLGYFIVSSGQRTDVDVHAVRELWLVLSGQGSLLRDGSQFDFIPGSLFVFSPYQEHQLIASSGQAVIVFNIWWHDD